ncbi:MAG TPA: YbaK/EbsC family protein [Anaeromyxobacter sp.]|nr:YbaK/EbsC family protein [Anaeromyxobacter sp.]
MIPQRIDEYLKQNHPACEHSAHMRAVAAQRVAAAEHVSGDRLAKTVVVRLDDELVLAVVAADRRVDLGALSLSTGALRAQLAAETEFAPRFEPCEAGAEPPLGLFGMPIYVDADLAREPWLVMRGGTHEDAIRMRTDEWLDVENVRVVSGLGRPEQPSLAH